MSNEPDPKLRLLAPDLTRTFPRSPRETLGGYVMAARVLDKCRALLNGTSGEYKYVCFMNKIFFEFSGLDSDEFKAFVATGAADEEVAAWIAAHARPRERIEVVRWNNAMRERRLSELPAEVQLFMEDYIPKVVPPNRLVRCWFDVYDLEEQRI